VGRVKVSIVTNKHATCGVAEYSRQLALQLAKFYGGAQPELIEFPQWPSGGDVLVLNWHPSRFTLTVSLIQQMRATGRKVILIYQNSFEDGRNLLDPWGTQIHGLRGVVDALVSHEPIEGWDVDFIPHGILEVPLLSPFPYKDLTFGSAGFPLPHKRIDLVVDACLRYGARPNFIFPAHDYLKFDADINKWQAQLGVTIPTAWRPAEEVVRALSRNHLNIFWFQSVHPKDLCGQSGGVRLGLAARRPVILSRHRKFRTLFEFEDEIYFAETEKDLQKIVEDVVFRIKQGSRVRAPDRVVKEQGWSRAAEKYQAVIERVA
jgi:hypothetical protein